ncbi:MAG: hypothetical protein IPL47_15000 [Phyllobacteriaceae bacterium]|nr:hypothetical protein [Phyllobacteriaceae bacterium]
MPDQNDQQAQALIEALAPKLIEAILPKIAESVEAQIGGIKKKNDELLGKLADTKKPDSIAAIDNLMAMLSKQEKERAMQNAGFTQDATGNWVLGGSQQEAGVYLSREDARNPSKYREAKQEAEKRGVPLRVTDTAEDPTRRNTGQSEIMKSTVFTFDDEHERVRYVRADMQTGTGIVHRRLQAEREGYKVRTFRSLDDLPGHMQDKFRRMEMAANAGGNNADPDA